MMQTLGPCDINPPAKKRRTLPDVSVQAAKYCHVAHQAMLCIMSWLHDSLVGHAALTRCRQKHHGART